MVFRLVLGCGSVGYKVVEQLRPLHGRVEVVCANEGRVDSLRGDNVDAHVADPTDRAALSSFLDGPDLFFVAGDDPRENLAAAEAVRAERPDAVLIAYYGVDADERTRERLDALADRVVDPVAAVAGEVTRRTSGAAAQRARRLRTALVAVDGPLAVVMHDNPDPDAIASAVALTHIAASLGLDATACYYGDVTHQENRAFVNLLDLDLRNLDRDDDLAEFAGFALVDHSRPGVNDQLPKDLDVDVVIDHHPPRVPVDAVFADLRHDVGATSTLLTEYLVQFDVPIDRSLATALLYGVQVDTHDFTREISRADFEAAATLISDADVGILERVESPSIGVETLEVLARAIRNREIEGNVLATSVGRLTDRDALAQAADRLLGMDGVTTTLVYGLKDDTVFVSARSRGVNLDLGETLRDAFDQIGSAGGHADMAGAQIPLGVLTSMREDETLTEEDIVHDVVTDRFFDTMRDHPLVTGRFEYGESEFVFPFDEET